LNIRFELMTETSCSEIYSLRNSSNCILDIERFERFTKWDDRTDFETDVRNVCNVSGIPRDAPLSR